MKEVLQKLNSQSLSSEETYLLFESFLADDTQKISDEDIRAYLRASSQRLPTAAELIGAARSLRLHMTRIDCDPSHLIDTCGTGGSGLSSFNASTAAAVIAVASGVQVAKHGNRSISSRCGSADILEALHIPISHTPDTAKEAIEKTGFAFLFAPLFHPATKRVQLIRKELGIRTIFNFLGPLCNPAGVRNQLLGVSDKRMVASIAEALLALGAERAIIACGDDGLDEVTLSGKTLVAELKDNRVEQYEVEPEDFGCDRAPLEKFSGAEPEQAALLVQEMFAGKTDARSAFVALNAGAALYIGKAVPSWKDGVTAAKEILSSGRAEQALQNIIRFHG